MKHGGRGGIWRFDRGNCAPPQARPRIVHAAAWGIAGITGTFGRMEPAEGIVATAGPSAIPGADILICYETYPPYAWIDTLTRRGRDAASHEPVLILSHDGAFAAFHPAGERLVATLRRKVARAMAGPAGRAPDAASRDAGISSPWTPRTATAMCW
ncbi:hypothetical protein [Hoeflea sp.]|uniref:hypothetical protein n=1 Tax=Hoeflea sp. TaxID=1940281 RepID=UPI003B014518